MKTGEGCFPGMGNPAIAHYNCSNPDCWTATSRTYCPQPVPHGKADVFQNCANSSGNTCCSPLKCFPFSEQFSQCCIGHDNPPGCASWGLSDRVSPAAVAPPPRRSLLRGGRTEPFSASGTHLTRDVKGMDGVRGTFGAFFGSSRGAQRAVGAAAAESFDASDTYCPSPKPAGSADVFDACTPGLNETCCQPLTCVALSSSYSACCLSKGDPPGCGSPPPPPPPPQSCGVQYVAALKGYETDALGKTTSAAFNTCNTTVDSGYDNPALCNQPVPQTETCDGQMEMTLVNYPQYGRSQYECKQKPRARPE